MMEVASIAIYGFPTKPSTWTEIIIAHQRKGKAMDDLISRQRLLEYIHGEPVGRLLCDKYNLDGLIEQLPSAEPAQPKTGKWILDRSGAYCCSECMEPCATYVMMKPRDKYCKMCGSRNEVTE